MKLVLASKNQGKLKELTEILGEMDIQVVLQSEFGVDLDVEETGTTFEENALLKARAVMEATGFPAIADDSGLVVDALGGAPGVYSARYGNCHSDEERTQLLLKNMEQVAQPQRTARFVSSIACCFPGGATLASQGTCEGEITTAPAGCDGFGYDPIFYYKPMGKTFAQMTAEEKNTVSHRKVALMQFLERLKERQGEWHCHSTNEGDIS